MCRCGLLTIVAALLFAAPAAAQVDFSGEWGPLYHEDRPERMPGPELGDYMGLPISDAARRAADSWDADRISVVTQYQCRPHSSDYGMRGLGNLRVWREINPANQQLTAFHTYMPAWGSERTIWMDGRPHPPAGVEHTFQGFSTGTWDGNTLVITTSHLKTNYYRRNGVPSSDKRTFTEYWTRHGDILTGRDRGRRSRVSHRAARSQPELVSRSRAGHAADVVANTCPRIPGPVADAVPNHLPDTNPYLAEVADGTAFRSPPCVVERKRCIREFRLKMGPPHAKPPAHCERYCVCSEQDGCSVNPPRPRR
jgi:hypothetical protein